MKRTDKERKVIKLKRKLGILLIGSALLVLCAFIGTASADIIYVPDDHETIQWAVDNASAEDTIIVRDGTYTENVAVYISLTIRSENGSASTIVEASNTGDHVFNVSADYVNISGFTVIDATSYWRAGIYLGNVDHCDISSNNASNNYHGIWLYDSSNNNLTSNNASNNADGIFLESSNYNNLTGNNASNNANGIWLDGSSNNNLTSNNASNNHVGIWLYHSSNNNLTSNNANSNNYVGIWLSDSSNNNLTSNNANSNNDAHGICLTHSSNHNNLTSNNALNNDQNGIVLLDSSDNTLANNHASNNDGDGIWLYHSSNYNNLTSNNASNNYKGIFLDDSSNNNLTSNNASSNDDYGIYLNSSSNNLIYNNYFNNTNNVYDNGSNIWNTTKTLGTNIIGGPYLGGNYWSDYAGIDTDDPSDGLGDTSIPYNSSGNISYGGDYLPLTTRTPNTAATDIINDVNALVDDEVLNQGQGTALIAKLDQAIIQMDKGNKKAAINLLQAFINNVESLFGDGILSEEQRDSLIDFANEIIEALNGT